ncbi:hypothetical protein V3C99_014422 [Haemonchus contortus]
MCDSVPLSSQMNLVSSN